MAKSKGFEFCCPLMQMACDRANDKTMGIRTSTMFKPNGKRLEARVATIISFPKAKKGDETKYGYTSEFKNSTYGICKWCPFCGKRLEPEEKAEEPKAAAPRPSRKRNGGVAGDGAKPGPVQPSDG